MCSHKGLPTIFTLAEVNLLASSLAQCIVHCMLLCGQMVKREREERVKLKIFISLPKDSKQRRLYSSWGELYEVQ